MRNRPVARNGENQSAATATCRHGAALLPLVMLAAISAVAISALSGCRQGPSSQVQQCRQRITQLEQQLSEEQQLRRRTELEIRRLADRLAESEKELARNFGSSLAERPGQPRRDASGAPSNAPSPADNSVSSGVDGLGASDSGWRPSRDVSPGGASPSRR